MGPWRNAYASVLETDALGIESSNLSGPTIISQTQRVPLNGRQAVSKTVDTRKVWGSIPPPSAKS